VGSEPGDIRTISYQRETQTMAHPIIEEFCRIHSPERMQTIFFRRMQRVLRDEVQPMLDERDRLLVEVEELKAKAAEPVKVSVELDGRSIAEVITTPTEDYTPLEAVTRRKKVTQ
jgi:hypothetical protein